jgi:hypothetical protein
MFKRNLMCGLLAVGLLMNVAWADEEAPQPAQAQPAPLNDGGVQAVLESQADGLAAENVQNAETIVTQYMNRKKFHTNISKKVIFAVGIGKVVLSEEVAGKNTLLQRDLAATMALIDARMEIMRTIASEMSGEQISELYQDPITQKVPENVQKDHDAYLESAKAIFAAAQKDDYVQMVEDKELSGQKLIDTIDQVGGTDEAMAANKALRGAYLEAVKVADNVKNELASLTSKVDLASRLVLIGTSVLAQSESIAKNDKGQNELTVAILMVWSDKLMKGAAAILEGKSVTFEPDKKGRDVWDWMETQNPATLLGGRQFIDKDGKMWFLGASSRVREGNTVEQRKARAAAKLTARTNTVYFLFSEAALKESLEQTMKTYTNLANEESNDANEKVAESFRQSYKNLNINGLQEIIGGEYPHPLLNNKIFVSVMGINSGDVETLRSIRDNFYKKAKEINTAQERERGKVAELENQYQKSKDNPAARAEGAGEAKGIMNEKQQEKVLDVKKGQQGGKIRNGATAIPDNGDENAF